MKPEEKAIMTPRRLGWEDFRRRMAGPTGLNFHQDPTGGLVWKCNNDDSLPLARRILAEMGTFDVELSVLYFHAHGACCDCEVIWSVGRGLELPTHLWEATAAT